MVITFVLGGEEAGGGMGEGGGDKDQIPSLLLEEPHCNVAEIHLQHPRKK